MADVRRRKDREPAVRRDRLTEVQSMVDAMKSEKEIPEGRFTALGMLITDASLAADESALEAAHNGLRWLYGRYVRDGADIRAEQRGRLLGLIDVTYWSLRRLPSGLQLSLDPSSHAARFLVEIAREPGLNNETLAERLDVDVTEVSRIGRRMLASGVAWRSRQWRHNSWDVTPRGMHYLEETGLLPQPQEPAAPAPEEREADLDHFVGVKVRPSRLTGAVIDASGTTLTRADRELNPVGSEREAVTVLADFVAELMDRAPAVGGKAGVHRTGLGIEIGAHVSAERGEVVKAPNYAAGVGWSGLTLAGPLREATGLPTVLENDANALALAEAALGDTRARRHSAVVLVDHGVGAGIVADGRILHGATGAAGEIGHVVVEPDGPQCSCGNRGCLESVVGVDAIARRVRELTALPVRDLDAVLALLSTTWSKQVEDVLEHAGTALGTGLSALVNFTDPERIVLYGPPGLVCPDDWDSAALFMAKVRETVTSQVFSTEGKAVTLTTRPYGDAAGARAAAVAALRLLTRR
ncbi:ROK family protein [Streptomyces sp. S3(2020)]|uniref:ROK family protein n=1 Tax=Streptomyces sp. S3(2020) TaxID=2732044 RepID=UPI00148822C6|nr:ROK family protein [Streptomyces sp. S3(2020)]NNN30484.1 ROK family protein [Streptomyces sp. S3(2020)]